MGERRRCRTCGAELVVGASPQGLCARCLLEAGLKSTGAASDSRQDKDRNFDSLPRARRRPAFPGVRAVGGCGRVPRPLEAPGVADSSCVVRAGAGSGDREARMAGAQTGVRPGGGTGARAGSGGQGEVGRVRVAGGAGPREGRGARWSRMRWMTRSWVMKETTRMTARQRGQMRGSTS